AVAQARDLRGDAARGRLSGLGEAGPHRGPRARLAGGAPRPELADAPHQHPDAADREASVRTRSHVESARASGEEAGAYVRLRQGRRAPIEPLVEIQVEPV